MRSKTLTKTSPGTSSAAASPSSSSSSSGGTSSGAYPSAPASSYSGGDAATDVSSNTGCRDLTFIFARGTGELGTMGTVVGPPIAQALQSSLGKNAVSVQGVNYAASAAGNADLGSSGGLAMASLAKQALSACPKTKLVLSGYSQGAMVVHNALSSRGVNGANVAAVALFGDPLNGEAVQGVDKSKVDEVCGSSEFICDHGPTSGSGSHLSYGSDAAAAAKFIISATGL
jgi:cutinase